MIANFFKRYLPVVLLLATVMIAQRGNGQIVLNEVKVRPELAAATPPNGLIYEGSKEYVELYNAGCTPVNVAGYYIAMRTQPFSTLIQGGTLRIPDVPAATIPARSHIVIAPASAAPSADIDIVITSANVPYCTYGGAGKFSVANVDSWIALYDATGKPIDGMYWTADPNNITKLPDFVGDVCLPAGSPITVLPTVLDIYNTDPAKMKYVGGNFINDSILVRQVDGTGDWVRNQPSSITKSATSGNCNGGTCTSAIPTFDAIGPLCQNTTAPLLPTTSKNGVQGTWDPPTISTAEVGTKTYIFTPSSSSSCAATPLTISIEVISGTAPTLALTSASGTNDQSVTLNTAINNITYSYSPTNLTPDISGLPTGVTASVSNGVVTISGSPSTDVGSPFNYTVTLASACGSSALNGKITITLPVAQNTFSFSCTKDTTIQCASACITLKAQIPNLRSSTAEYLINPITDNKGCFRPYVPGITPGNPISLNIDDDYSGKINLPFSFPFFDDAASPYNSLIVSPNGYLSFDVTKANTESHYGILRNSSGNLSALSGTEEDMPSLLYDRSIIMSAYQDIDLSSLNSPDKRIKYEVTGNKPHRRFVLTYYKAPLFFDIFYNPSCPGLIENTHQIVLYEGLGVIEVFINGIENCLEWNNGKSMTGLQNYNKDKAYIPAGRKASDPVWGKPNLNESWRFVPAAGTTLYRSVELYDLQGKLISTGDTTSISNSTFEVSFPNVCPNGNTTYIVKSKYEELNNPGNFVFGTDTVNVITIDNLNLSTRNDTTICLGASVQLASLSNADSYSWTGAGLNDATLLSPVATPVALGVNSYTVTATRGQCTKTATVKITVDNLNISTRNDTTICFGASVELTSSGNADSYSWTGSGLNDATLLSPVATPSTLGVNNYTITATRGQCTNTASVKITVESQVQVNAGDNVSILSGDKVQLNGTATGATNYLWTSSPVDQSLTSTTVLNPVVSPNATTTYTLTGTNASGCKASADVTVTVVTYCVKVYNAFSPNGDGINDFWKVYDSYDCIKKVKVNVYNRYGSKVYESSDYKNTWNGLYSGKPVPDGTYYAVIEYMLVSGKTITTKTDLTIVR